MLLLTRKLLLGCIALLHFTIALSPARPTVHRQVSMSSTATSTAISTAAMAAAAVSQAVSMKSLSAPDIKRSSIALDLEASSRGEVDKSGLPLVYNKELIEKYWSKERGALQARWGEFLRYSVPFLTRVAALLIKGG